MPFIRGRYYVNPIAGEALEAAREAEGALLALRASQDENEHAQGDGADATQAKPVRRIEIEMAELVPAHSGRSTKGYIARLHREDESQPDAGQDGTQAEKRVFYDPGQLVNFLRDELAKNGNCR